MHGEIALFSFLGLMFVSLFFIWFLAMVDRFTNKKTDAGYIIAAFILLIIVSIVSFTRQPIERLESAFFVLIILILLVSIFFIGRKLMDKKSYWIIYMLILVGLITAKIMDLITIRFLLIEIPITFLIMLVITYRKRNKTLLSGYMLACTITLLTALLCLPAVTVEISFFFDAPKKEQHWGIAFLIISASVILSLWLGNKWSKQLK